MMETAKINIALCFNHENDARMISDKLKEVGPQVEFVITKTLDEFLKAIAKLDKIDCFIVEEKYIECSAFDLLAKLKKSARYKKSVLALFTPDFHDLHPKYRDLHLDYVFDQTSEFRDVNLNLSLSILQKLTPPIPVDFNVLVLDDNPDALEIVSTHLKDLGHKNMVTCTSIKEAKEKIKEHNFDLLLLDWNLDDGTCIDLIEHIQNTDVGVRTKAALSVVITGRDDVDDIMTLLRYGVKDHIIKPFEFHEFEEKIRYAVEKHLKK